MSNPQLAEIDASLQAMVRRAYELGRDDVLRKVVDSLRADQPGSERLALMAPDNAARGDCRGHQHQISGNGMMSRRGGGNLSKFRGQRLVAYGALAIRVDVGDAAIFTSTSLSGCSVQAWVT